MGDSQRGQPDPEARETVEEWYYKRYRSGTAWEHHWAVSSGTNSRVICSEKEASSVITTPMYIISLMKPRQNITCLLRSKLLSIYHFIATPIHISI